jgi:hypothetical protein
MLDQTLHDLSTAYMLHELDNDEYRRRRTEYIDKATGYVEPNTELSENENKDSEAKPPFQKPDRLKYGILIISLSAILFLILYSLFSASNH